MRKTKIKSTIEKCIQNFLIFKIIKKKKEDERKKKRKNRADSGATFLFCFGDCKVMTTKEINAI
jgi:hypothetical protein